MTVERCDECGFDGGRWTDSDAVAATTELPFRWSRALADLSDDDLKRRAIAGMWSIAEYTDHVRETTFGMRFVLDVVVVGTPGADLGDPPEPRFEAEPRDIDTFAALSAFEGEIRHFCEALRDAPSVAWTSSCTIGGDSIDIQWIARHALHDITHHLGDIERLRAALGKPSSAS